MSDLETSDTSTESNKINPNPIADQGIKIVLLDTPEQLIEHAKSILNDAKNPEWNDVPLDKKLEAFQDKYKEFGRTFPIVLRHIIQSKKLYIDVLKRYILLCKHHPTHSMSEFQERQADYLVMIYRKEHPRCSQREIAMVKQKHVDDLKREEEYMKKVMEVVQKERQELAKKYDIERRKDLQALISKCINDVPDDVVTDVVVDPPKAQEAPEPPEVESLVLVPESIKK
jgi:hypothetical protein